MGDIIYHYCSNETFLEIIKNKTLRLSDLNKTNDSMEKKYGYGLILEVLKQKFIKYEINMDLEEEYFYDEGIESHLAMYKKEVSKVLDEGRPILITCFSNNSDKLSQWRGYAADGQGVAIGFNKEIISKLRNENRSVLIGDVAYGEVNGKKLIDRLIEKNIALLQSIYENEELYEIMENEFDSFCERLIRAGESSFCLIKNIAFKEEEEVRVIYNPKIEGFEELDSKDKEMIFKEKVTIENFKINPLNFNYRNGQLVVFCDISFANKVSEGIIEEIIIGPKSKLTENDIKYFLAANGIDDEKVNIEKSSATYR